MDNSNDRQYEFWSMDQIPNHLMNAETYWQLRNIWNHIFRHFMIFTSRNMKYELLRLFTFLHFPRSSQQDIRNLAIAGFYYFGDGDTVVCYCCGLCKRNWTLRDVPLDIHRRLSNRCSFLQRNSEVNIPYYSTTEGGFRPIDEITRILQVRLTGPMIVRPAEIIQAEVLANVRIHRGTRVWDYERYGSVSLLPVANLPSAFSVSWWYTALGITRVIDNNDNETDAFVSRLSHNSQRDNIHERQVYSIRRTDARPFSQSWQLDNGTQHENSTVFQYNSIWLHQPESSERASATNLEGASFNNGQARGNTSHFQNVQMKDVVDLLAEHSISTRRVSDTQRDETEQKTLCNVEGQYSLADSSHDEIARTSGYDRHYAHLTDISDAEQPSLTSLKDVEVSDETIPKQFQESVEPGICNNEDSSNFTIKERTELQISRQSLSETEESNDTNGEKRLHGSFDKHTETETPVPVHSNEAANYGMTHREVSVVGGPENKRQHTYSVSPFRELRSGEIVKRVTNEVHHHSPCYVPANEDDNSEEPSKNKETTSDAHSVDGGTSVLSILRYSKESNDPANEYGDRFMDIGESRNNPKMITISLADHVSTAKDKHTACATKKMESNPPNKSAKENRQRSFRNNSVCPSEKLADCGFYFTGHAGYVSCFSCGKEFETSKLRRDIWIQHAKASKNCKYVLQRKGQDFVSAVLEGNEEILQKYMDLFAAVEQNSIVSESVDNESKEAVVDEKPKGHWF